ncbi:MAG: hypothetical protein ACREBG_01835 [Pyrinomonadaceae bacterium]
MTSKPKLSVISGSKPKDIEKKIVLTLVHVGGAERVVKVLRREGRGQRLLVKGWDLSGLQTLDLKRNRLIEAKQWKAKSLVEAWEAFKEIGWG